MELFSIRGEIIRLDNVISSELDGNLLIIMGHGNKTVFTLTPESAVRYREWEKEKRMKENEK